MTGKLTVAFALCSIFARCYGAPAAAPPTDPLHRSNPRSAVTAFLEACHQNDYSKAAEYLDLTHIAVAYRAQEGPKLAKDLQQILNSASGFDVLSLSQDPQGNLGDDTNPNLEHVTTVTIRDQPFTVELARNTPANAPAYWVFSANTVAKAPEFIPIPNTESNIEARLPRFLVTTLLLDTPIWKWISLLLAALILMAIFRLFVRLFSKLVRSLHFTRTGSLAIMEAAVDPLLALVCVLLFRLTEEVIAPAALTRLYLGRTLLMVVVGAFAWGLINILDYSIVRLDHVFNQKQRVVSRSIIYLSRRVLKTIVAIFAAILILDNWGFNMTTIIAGLGVGGIAVALAAQQTIANVFGGVSVIGDSPVMLGDFGNFGGVMGTVEEIGLRSARIRTLQRTVVSIPNSSFAGMNLENYAVRDKILFNPTFAVKRSVPKDQIRQLLEKLGQMLTSNRNVEVGPVPVRISGYSAASFTVEVFAYVLTSDSDEFYKRQAELYLAMDEVITSLGIELA